MSELEDYLRLNAEPLIYMVFFGTLVVLALAETIFARAGDSRRRQRWPGNWALTVLNILVLGALPVTALVAADWAKDAGVGLFNMWDVPALLGLAVGVLARSWLSWGWHLCMHKLPPLWRLHRVHHLDTRLDVSTTVRFHPLETVVGLPAVLLLTIALGLPPVAILIYELFDAAMAVFSHANVRLPKRLERATGWVLVTPSMHRVHHSAWQRETDSNYGATLSIWDRAFGTFRARPEKQLAAMRLGLDEARDGRQDRLLWILSSPFRRLTLQADAPAEDEHAHERRGRGTGSADSADQARVSGLARLR